MKMKSRILWAALLSLLFLPNALRSQVDFREETIYFLITTRFFDGDPSNNRPNEWCSYPYASQITDPQDVTWRGDFKGLIQKLDYIKDLGFTAIWITPIVQNWSPLDYHGYHAYDFTKVDPRLESPGATFQDLIDEVHKRGMKIVLDVVTNHAGRYGIKGQAEIKYNTDPNQPWGKDKAGNTLKPNPNWQYDGMTPNPDDDKIWSRANLPTMPAPYNSNLAAYNWPSTESYVKTSDPKWYHHSGNGFAQGWDDTTNLYQRALAGDTPDLHTESAVVREYLVKAYQKYIEMGVDAFRWDTIKHMSKQDVLYFLKAFKKINPDLFVFGEVAQKRHELHQVEEINPHWYTWEGAVGNSANSGMAVLDFYAEATFHNVFEDGGGFSGVTAAARYDHLYADPSTNLLWLDNHDFGPNNDWNRRFGGSAENLAACMNFMFTWRGIPVVYYGTEMQFKKGAYTDIHEASDIQRSIDNTGRAYYGGAIDQAPSHKVYQHIKKLNAIRRAIPALQKGSWQWAGNGPGNGVGYIRKYAGSEVAVGLAKDGDASFTFTGMTNGIYRDAVTGKEVNVTNGTLSFWVKSTSAGIYVLNGPGMIGGNGNGFFEAGSGASYPFITIAPESGNYESAIEVKITTTRGTIYYTTDGSTPTANSAKYTAPFSLSQNTTVKAIAIDGDQTSSVATAAYTFGTIPGFRVYFKKPAAWSSVKIYYWDNIPATGMPSVLWPGVNMTDEGDGWWSFFFQKTTSTKLIFNNGGSGTGNQTADLTRDKQGWFDNGTWYDTKPGGITPGPGFTVYFYKPEGWNTPKIYYWDVKPTGIAANATWPGPDMTLVEGNWYKYTFAQASSASFRIHDNNGKQTADLTRGKDGWYYDSQWHDTKPVVLAIDLPDYVLKAISASPNPAHGEVAFAFRLDKPRHARLAIYDLLGNEIAVLTDKRMSADWHRLEMSLAHLPAGIYLYRFTLDGQSLTKKLVVE
jgi:glycosidase